MEVSNPGEFPHVIDSTIRNEFVSCMTKGYYSFVRNLGGKGASIDLIAGGAFARGLEVVRKLHWGSGKPFPEALEAGMAEALAEYTKELGPAGIPEGKEKKGPDRVIQAMDAYFERWPITTDHIQPMMDSEGQPMAEYTFSVPLPFAHPQTGDPLVYAGRFDLVGLYMGQVVGLDEKTTSQLGETWNAKWNLRGQFTGYCWAMRQFKIPAVGMIVRGISFLSKSFGTSESIQMRSDWQIDQWYAQLLRDVERMLIAYQTGWYDQNFGETCAEYGGCPFQKLCTAQNPETWIGGFAERKWNPLARIPYNQPPTPPSEIIEDPFIKGMMERLR